MGGTTALHLPARRGDTETLQIIFDEAKKRDGNISFNDLIRRDSNDFTPVDLAAQWGHLNVIELFLKNDVPVCRPNNIGFVPLHHAIKYSSYNSSMELINFLLQQDNNRIDRINDKGESSLHFVSNPQICKWLILEKNAKINQQDNDYFTPLHTAIKAGNVEVVKVLLAHGADTSLKANVAGFTGTKRPHTPLQYVEKLVSENPDKHEYKKIHEELKAPSLHR